MSVSSVEPVPARDAAVLIVTRDSPAGIETYMLRRSAGSRAFPDAYVFPGGAVDDDDRSAVARGQLAGTWRPAEHEFVYAAIRETFEECGLLYADAPIAPERLRASRAELLQGARTFAHVVDALGVRLDAEALHYFARRIAPPDAPIRFDARFFVARLPLHQRPEADEAETSSGRWIRPAEMVAAAEAKVAHVLPPTVLYLRRLAAFDNVASLLAFADAQATVEPDRRL
jgi:8-oxo-dGTP pyrophosphatase MutT (NUDIX family)